MRIEISPTARQQLIELVAWWNENRTAARVRVEPAFDDALALVAKNPKLGRVYVKEPRYRTKQLKGTPYYLVYRVDESQELIRVAAVWRSIRGAGPELG